MEGHRFLRECRSPSMYTQRMLSMTFLRNWWEAEHRSAFWITCSMLPLGVLMGSRYANIGQIFNLKMLHLCNWYLSIQIWSINGIFCLIFHTISCNSLKIHKIYHIKSLFWEKFKIHVQRQIIIMEKITIIDSINACFTTLTHGCLFSLMKHSRNLVY